MTLTEYEAMIDADFEKRWAENEWIRSKITIELAKQIYGWGFMDGWDARRSYPLGPPPNPPKGPHPKEFG